MLMLVHVDGTFSKPTVATTKLWLNTTVHPKQVEHDDSLLRQIEVFVE